MEESLSVTIAWDCNGHPQSTLQRHQKIFYHMIECLETVP